MKIGDKFIPTRLEMTSGTDIYSSLNICLYTSF